MSLGFHVEPFGMLAFKLDSIPAIAGQADAETLFLDVLDEVSKNNDIVVLKDRVIKHACTSAVKAGDKLSHDELTDLVLSFIESGVVPTCPHGRPVMTVITKKQLEKSFKRAI